MEHPVTAVAGKLQVTGEGPRSFAYSVNRKYRTRSPKEAFGAGPNVGGVVATKTLASNGSGGMALRPGMKTSAPISSAKINANPKIYRRHRLDNRFTMQAVVNVPHDTQTVPEFFYT